MPWKNLDDNFSLPERDCGDAPIFILAAGWRSGSTLLQRLLVSSGEAIVWGEPYGRLGLIQALTTAALGCRDDWPNDKHFGWDEIFERPQDAWIANLFPHAKHLKAALTAPLDELIAVPARERGFKRFGMKEVRLQGMHARFLQWAYPNARFIFLVRNPYDAWRSARGLGLATHWSGPVMDHPAKFATHWARLARSFLSWQEPAALHLRFEELRSIDLDALAAHCQLDAIDGGVMNNVIRGTPGPKNPPLSYEEERIIRETAGVVAEAYGYTGPTMRRAAG